MGTHRNVLLRDMVPIRRIHIHDHGDANHGEVDAVKSDVLVEPVRNEGRAYEVNEVGVETDIDDGEDALLDTIPYFVIWTYSWLR